jgi:hypothetical protein
MPINDPKIEGIIARRGEGFGCGDVIMVIYF